MLKKNLPLILLFIVISGVFLFSFLSSKKTAYVNTYQVYEQFKLKKELEKKLKQTELGRQTVLDSIKAKIQFSFSNKLLNEAERNIQISELKEAYYLKEQQFSKENETQAQQYTSQIWEQLNQYIKEFGNENKYDYIYGATGEGNLMFANEKEDITSVVIEFVNKRYEGHK